MRAAGMRGTRALLGVTVSLSARLLPVAAVGLSTGLLVVAAGVWASCG